MPRARRIKRGLTDEEIQLFERYAEERASGSISIRDQKKHAEVMLEVLRPHEWQVYQLRKSGWDFDAIISHLGISAYAAFKLRDNAVYWLRRALCGKQVD